jgi:hypothetical protein
VSERFTTPTRLNYLCFVSTPTIDIELENTGFLVEIRCFMEKNPNNDTAGFSCTPFCRWGAFSACGFHFSQMRQYSYSSKNVLSPYHAGGLLRNGFDKITCENCKACITACIQETVLQNGKEEKLKMSYCSVCQAFTCSDSH